MPEVRPRHAAPAQDSDDVVPVRMESVTLSVVVMAHPKRREWAEALAARLDPCPIIYDPEPDGEPSSWRTARLAWAAHREMPDATHHMVVQDDAIPCYRFLHGAHAAIAARPDRCLSFYGNRKEIGAALERGESWARVRDFLNAQAVVLPVGWIRQYVAYGDAMGEGDDDWRLQHYLKAMGEYALLSAPSLVQHGSPDSGLLGHGKMPIRRVSRWFADDLGIDVTTIDWTKGAA